jgi:hypothetical protein
MEIEPLLISVQFSAVPSELSALVIGSFVPNS